MNRWSPFQHETDVVGRGGGRGFHIWSTSRRSTLLSVVVQFKMTSIHPAIYFQPKFLHEASGALRNNIAFVYVTKFACVNCTVFYWWEGCVLLVFCRRRIERMHQWNRIFQTSLIATFALLCSTLWMGSRGKCSLQIAWYLCRLALTFDKFNLSDNVALQTIFLTVYWEVFSVL